MGAFAFGDLLLLILLPAGVWAMGAAWIRLSDMLERRAAQAARARRDMSAMPPRAKSL